MTPQREADTRPRSARAGAAAAQDPAPRGLPGEGVRFLLDVPPVMLECPPPGLPLLHSGKVRDIFAVDGERLLLVATDRLSAFDVVFGQGIPGKGVVLTQMSALWFAATAGIVPGHLLSLRPVDAGLGADLAAVLEGRAMVVRRASRVDVECVVRGYLAGGGWREYVRQGSVCGIPLPSGLRMNARLPEPIFTPAWKNDVGHDENVSFAAIQSRLGAELADRLRECSLRLYAFAAARCADAGILLADTKFEFGFVDGALTVIDELCTPDSSRFWPVERHRPGEPVDSLDKQPVRDFVEASGWDLAPPAPVLPAAVVAACAARYQDALRRLRGVLLPSGAGPGIGA